MPRIYVRAKPGRVARLSPKGPYIPYDEFISAVQTPYLDRLANVHEDIEVSVAPVAKRKKADPAPVTE